MSIQDFDKVTIDALKGPWVRADTTDIPVGNALMVQNGEYNLAQVQKRFGFIGVWTDELNVLGYIQATSIFCWIKDTDILAVEGVHVIIYDRLSGNVYDYSSPSVPARTIIVNALAFGALGVVCASSGFRLFIATFKYNFAPVGAGPVRVFAVTNTDVFSDDAFIEPEVVADTTISAVAAGAGKCTAGLHRIGFVTTSRTGFMGKLSPITPGTTDPVPPYGDVYTPTEYSCLDATKHNIAITTSWSPTAIKVQLVYTPSDSLNQHFLVPGQIQAVVGGSTSTVNFVLNISDDDLLSQATEVTVRQGLITRRFNGAAPFNPHFVFIFGERMGYIADINTPNGIISTCYFSQPEDHQAITQDQHSVTLPGFLKMCVAFVLRKVCYILGPDWTYAIEDNGDVPVTWPLPSLVDGQIGSLATLGVTVNGAGGFAWVVSRRGLEIFASGAYGSRPGSFYVSDDWARINFMVAYCVNLTDDQVRQRVLIAVPLDGATSPSHIMHFSYQSGLTPEALAEGYSLWNIDNFNLGALGLVLNQDTGQFEPWIGSSDAQSPICRQQNKTDTHPRRDLDQPAQFSYKTGVLPRATDKTDRMYVPQAVSVRVTGKDPAADEQAGVLNITVNSLDDKKSRSCRDIVLSTAPGQEFLRRVKTGMQSQGFTLSLSETTLDGYVAISMLTFYYSKGFGTSRG